MTLHCVLFLAVNRENLSLSRYSIMFFVHLTPKRSKPREFSPSSLPLFPSANHWSVCWIHVCEQTTTTTINSFEAWSERLNVELTHGIKSFKQIGVSSRTWITCFRCQLNWRMTTQILLMSSLIQGARWKLYLFFIINININF